MNQLVTRPSLVEWGPLRFLIMDHPKPSNLHLYLKECKKHNVVHIVRISEEKEQYSKEEVENAGIHLHDMFYPDGQSPPMDVIERWVNLVSETFDQPHKPEEAPCIALHCVAGLGRAPVLAAIALMEYGMDAMAAVQLIRSNRRGAINQVQLVYLSENYRCIKKSKSKCVIS